MSIAQIIDSAVCAWVVVCVCVSVCVDSFRNAGALCVVCVVVYVCVDVVAHSIFAIYVHPKSFGMSTDGMCHANMPHTCTFTYYVRML